MEELRVSQQAGEITANFDAIEAEITEQMAVYQNYVVTEDSVKADKKLIAELRKQYKSLDDARKSVKNAWMQPYLSFEERCKQVMAKVEEPINLINSQIKMFEEEKALKKRERVEEIYAENIQGLERFLPLHKIYNPKWDNVSYDEKTIIFDLNEMVLKVKNDLVAISALNSEIEDELIGTYERFGNDLSMAIQRNSQYLADKQAIAEREAKAKAEAEKKAQEEAESKVDNTEPVEIKDESKASPLEQLDHIAEVSKMVKFVVSAEDKEQVQEILEFAGITFSIEQ